MSLISYIKEDELENYSGFNYVEKLNSYEDVATLLETFLDVKSKVGFNKILNVVEDDEKFYYFIISNNTTNFDIYDFINTKSNLDVNASCLNAKTLFPRSKSRGIYDYVEEVENGLVEDNEDTEDTPTQYLDDKDVIVGKVQLALYNISSNTYTNIPDEGLIVGRSGKESTYVIKDNTSVGRKHCKLYYSEKGYLMVHDYNSLNGTFVNGMKVNEDKDVTIHEGDSLILANVEFSIVKG